MYKVDGNSIKLTRGDSFYTLVTMKRKDTGAEYTPQEGDVIRFGLKKSAEQTNCLIEKIIPNDTLILQLEPSDTKPFPFGKYVYDIEITFAKRGESTTLQAVFRNRIVVEH